MAVQQRPAVVMEEVTDPEELAKARVQDERFERNWAWFQAHIREIYTRYRGKCICIAGEELFAADTPRKSCACNAAHPEDNGKLFTTFLERKCSGLCALMEVVCSAMMGSCAR